ncbi:DUF4391 domain-containing protein [Candidatus Bipolaricaulota bacterium]
MIDLLYARMGLPEAAHLGKRIYKKMFHDNAQLSAADKKTLREDIDTITWAYTLKTTTIPIKAYADERHEYVEIAIIQVALRSQKRTPRIAEIIHRAIPYPVVLLLAYESSIRVSLATKRFSEAEKGAIVADEFLVTDWIDLREPSGSEKAFMTSLAVATLPHTDFRAFYDALAERVVALECAIRTGRFVVEDDAARSESRKVVLAECRDLEARIAEERAAVKKATQINRQVEGNLRIQQMQTELGQKVALL